MKLLLVDDDPDFRRLIVESAPSWLDVVPCGSTREATDLLSTSSARADVALIDLQMEPYLGEVPEREGLALVQWMSRERRRMPVIVATSGAPQELKAPAAEAAVFGILRKPIDLGLLYEYLEAFGRLFQLDRTSSVRRSYDGPRDGGVGPHERR